MNTRLWAIAWKEVLQLKRDRLTFAMTIGIPIIQLLLFGYAINTDVRHLPLVVCDHDQSAASRDLARSVEATQFYDLIGYVESDEDAGEALQRGAARAALVISAGYGSDVARGGVGRAQLLVDGSDPQTVASAVNAAGGLAAARSTELMAARIVASGASLPGVSIEPAIWYNPEQRTAVYIVPGLVGVLLTMTMVMFTAMALAREKERGTLEQLIVSPVRRWELIVGKILPYIAFGYLQMALILVVGRAAFSVPIVGSLGLLFAFSSVFIAANLALGILFSTVAKTQQQAMQMSFFFLLPNILLSGFMFPREGMPVPMQWISEALPLTHFLHIVRGIALKGIGAPELWREVAWLAGTLLILVIVASLRVRKKLA